MGAQAAYAGSETLSIWSALTSLPTSPRPFIQFFLHHFGEQPLDIASPLDEVKVSRLSIVKLPFVCVVAYDRRF
jgi:hypothetical protein